MTTTIDLHRTINEEYTKVGLDISVPQREVHLDTMSPLEVRGLPEVVDVAIAHLPRRSSEAEDGVRTESAPTAKAAAVTPPG